MSDDWQFRKPACPRIAPSFLAREHKLCWERLSSRLICHLTWHTMVLAHIMVFAEMLEGAD